MTGPPHGGVRVTLRAPPAMAPNSADPRAGTSAEAGTCTGKPLASANSCISSGLEVAIPPHATISDNGSPCSAKFSTIRRLPNAIDSSSAR